MTHARKPHATVLTEEVCRLFAGRYAAKRLARAIGWPLGTCRDYMSRRRRLSLDAAIEVAGREPAVLAALLRRVEEVREQQAAAGRPTRRHPDKDVD